MAPRTLVADGTRAELTRRRAPRPYARRLLLVTYHFPPSDGVGALRWAGLTKYLSRDDWQIRVVSAFGPAEWEYESAVRVAGRPRRRTLNDLYRGLKGAWRRRTRDSDEPSSPAPNRSRARAVGRFAGLPRRVLREMGGLLTWPDEGRGWILSAAWTTRAAIRDFSPDLIVSSGPPHSAHVSARLARGRSGIPWFIDLRDPWAQQEASTELSEATSRWLEAGAMRSASGVIVTTPELRNLLSDEYPDTPVHWIPNGVDLDDFAPPEAPPFPGLSVVHLGTIYRGRDPDPLLAAFERFLRETPKAREAGSAVRLVGEIAAPFQTPLAERARSDLKGHLELVPQVPRDEALEILQRSSLSLVLAQRQWEMVPAKLYESVALGIPTLVVAEAGSAAFEAAGRLGTLRAEPDDIEAILGALRQVWFGEGRPEGDPDLPLAYGKLARRTSRILRS